MLSPRPFFDVVGVVPFHQLQMDYGLPEGERFRYSQIRHWALHPQVKLDASRHLTSYEKWLLSRTTDKKLISDLYKMLTVGSWPR